jgi:hypothetical protein
MVFFQVSRGSLYLKIGDDKSVVRLALERLLKAASGISPPRCEKILSRDSSG